ncbi:hypothetical protein L1887_10345 [Cichorium endivia]|nr:hypothetical protein L1887_10345 [Cichorium endivia]
MCRTCGTSHAASLSLTCLSNVQPCSACAPPFSDKLEALKNLIPAQDNDKSGPTTTITDAASSADQLYQETADYILLLRTQVSILQKLVDIYGSSSSSLVQQ